MEYVSITKSNLHLLDVESGANGADRRSSRRQVAYEDAKFAPDGTLWVTVR